MTLSSGHDANPTARRRYRFEAKEPIPVLVQTAGNWQAGHIHNLSPRGAFLTLDADVWIGEEVKMIFGLPTGAGGRLSLRGLTVWRTGAERRDPSSEKPGYGLMIRDEPDRDSSLQQAISRLSQSGLLFDTEKELR